MADGMTPENLKLALQMPGRSQAALAKLLGKDSSIVSRMVNGQREIRAREIPIIVKYLAETANAKDDKFVISVDQPNAQSILTTMTSVKSADIRSFILSSLSGIIDAVEPKIHKSITFIDISSHEQFWISARNSLNAIPALALGVGAIPIQYGPQLAYLTRLAKRAIEFTGDAFEDDPEIRKLIEAYVGRSLDGKDEAQVRMAIAFSTSILTLQASGSPEDVITALNELSAAGADAIMFPAGKPPQG